MTLLKTKLSKRDSPVDTPKPSNLRQSSSPEHAIHGLEHNCTYLQLFVIVLTLANL